MSNKLEFIQSSEDSKEKSDADKYADLCIEIVKLRKTARKLLNRQVYYSVDREHGYSSRQVNNRLLDAEEALEDAAFHACYISEHMK